MPTPTVPSTGKVTLSDIKAAFNSIHGNKLSAYRGKHSSLPVNGPISLLNFRGITAVSPGITWATQSGTILSLDSTGKISGAVSASSVGSIVIDMLSSINNKQYNGTCTFVLASGNTLPTVATLTPLGILTISNAVSAFSSSCVITVTNSYGNTADMVLTFVLTSSAIAPSLRTAMTDVTREMFASSTTTYMYPNTLTYYFNGTPLTFTASSPHNNAYVTSSTLYITPAARSAGYNVTVTASNVLGSASSVFVVSEPNPPTIRNVIGSLINLQKHVVVLYLQDHFSNATSYSGTCTCSDSTAFIFNVNYIAITAKYRGVTYTVTVTATNAYGSVSQTFSVVEAAPPQTPWVTSQCGTVEICAPKSWNMADYFGGPIVSYGYSSTSYWLPPFSIANNIMTITPNNRGYNNSYWIDFIATNDAGLSSPTNRMTVYEYDYGTRYNIELIDWSSNSVTVYTYHDGSTEADQFRQRVINGGIQYIWFKDCPARYGNVYLAADYLNAPATYIDGVKITNDQYRSTFNYTFLSGNITNPASATSVQVVG